MTKIYFANPSTKERILLFRHPITNQLVDVEVPPGQQRFIGDMDLDKCIQIMEQHNTPCLPDKEAMSVKGYIGWIVGEGRPVPRELLERGFQQEKENISSRAKKVRESVVRNTTAELAVIANEADPNHGDLVQNQRVTAQIIKRGGDTVEFGKSGESIKMTFGEDHLETFEK